MKIKLSLNTPAGVALLFLFTTISALGQAQGGFVPEFPSFVTLVSSIVVQPDGNILAATPQTNSPFNSVSRFHPDGIRDRSFIPPTFVNSHARTITLQPDGKIMVGAEYSSEFTGARVYRLNPDGTRDTTFSTEVGANGAGRVNRIVIAPDGKIYIAGSFAIVQSVQRAGIARLESNGSLDAAFLNPQSDGEVHAVVLQPDGKLIVGGSFNNIGGGSRSGIARLNPDGTLDTSFAAPQLTGDGDVFSIASQQDGKLILGGAFTAAAGQQGYSNLMRLNIDGSVDPAFVPTDAQTSTIRAVAVQTDGRIVVGGGMMPNPFNANLAPAVVLRLNADGSRDNSISYISSDRTVEALAFQADGKILAGGSWRFTSPQSMMRIGNDGKPEVPFARFDFNGDGRAELAVFRPSNQTWYFHTGQEFSTFHFGGSGDRLAPADYDGDGKTDVAVFRQSNGTWYWINSSNITFSYLQWGEPGDLPVPGTRMFHRKASFDVYRPSNSTWYRLAQNHDGSYFIQSEQFGGVGDVPLVGDFDPTDSSNGVPVNYRSTKSLFRPSASSFLHVAWNQLFQPSSGTPWGQAGDIPLSANFDGDDAADTVVYRPSSGIWHIRFSGNSSPQTQTYHWGEPGDIPVPADYDGDQRDDIAVWRPSTGTWYIIGSTEGWRIQQFGEPGDIPIPSSYLYGLP